MKTLLTRALSALVAVILVCLFVYYGINGLRLLILLSVTLSIREGARLFFPDEAPGILQFCFVILTLALLVFGTCQPEWLAVGYGVGFVIFMALCLFFQKQFKGLEPLVRFQTRAAVGFFYLGLLPTFAMRILDIRNGEIWFIALMTVVFAGDTMAYLIGWKFGRHLLMPSVSPKKTVEGAFGGLLGSALAGFIFHYFLPHIPLVALLGLAILSGIAGQVGDLFESLLKRVANQKDSGSLMPGHGGALDRIDGVLFAAPFMFAGASLLEKWF